nr:hypothetical protein [Tanacetum cinerariifolium]
MLKTTGTSSKKDNIFTSNSFSVLNDDEENEDEAVENVYDKSDNLLPKTKTGENSSFTAAAEESERNKMISRQLGGGGGRFKLLRSLYPQKLTSKSSSYSVTLAKLKENDEAASTVVDLKHKVEKITGTKLWSTPGQYTNFICPSCKGGRSEERTLSFHISQNEKVATWRCFNLECGWAGHVLEDVDPTKVKVNRNNLSRKPTEETLQLEPLELLAMILYDMLQLIEYFAGRMISAEILQKNAVMQMIDDKNVIAFTYRRNGELVNCKFRSITSRRFWQAKHGERILYGLDGINEGNDIVIVEGEIDKLSMEQAGIPNCVSVPDGAPHQVSTKVLTSKKQNSRYKYISDCNGYLDKASRIILATDSDKPGQALAEELSCLLGKERCWRVTWPMKDESNCYKDANEVLVHLGAEALRHIVETAELYDAKNSELISLDFTFVPSILLRVHVKTAKRKEEEEVDADHASYNLSHCKGGQSKERSLWFHINQNEKLSMWRCSNSECEWAAHVLEDAIPTKDEVNKDNILLKPSEENLRLEPIGDEVLGYTFCYFN